MRTILKKLNSKYNEDNLVAHFLVSLNDSSINIRGNSIMFALKSKWTKVVSFLLVFIFSFSFTGGSFLTSQWINNVNVVYAAGEQEENKDQQEEATNSDKDDSKIEHSTEDDKVSKEETQHNKELQQMIELPEDGEYLKPITIEAYGELFIDEDEEEISHEDYENAYVERVDNEDGSHTASLYTKPIKYKDDEGNWIKIDNELEKTVEGNSTLLKSKASPVTLELPAEHISSSEVTIADGEETISFKPILNKISAKTDFNAKADVKFIKANDSGKAAVETSELKNNESYNAVKYENVFSKESDIVMQSVSEGVKEEIILNTIPEQEEFSFEFTVSGLTPVLRADNNLFFIDKQQTIAAVVPAPVMWDSAVEQRESYDIEVSVKKVSDTQFIYTLKPDRQWLEDENIVYPVTIDPSIKFQRDTAYETFITSKYRNNNYYADSHVKVGNSNDLGISRGLFGYIDFRKTIGDNKKITKATFTAYQDYTGASSPTIGLYMVTSYYHNEQVTWENQPTYSSVMASKAVSATGRHTWDATKLAQAMYAEDRSKFMMRNTNENVNMYKRFRSESYSNNSSDWPVLEVNYVDAPSAPASVTVETTGWTKDQIKVSWGTINQTTGATLTEVQYSTTSATSGFAKIPSPSNLKSGSATLDLPDGPTYVWIRGKNSLGLCGPAKQSNIKQQRDRTAPNIPNSLTGTTNFSGTIGSITANWSASTDKGSGIDHYNLRLKKDDGAWGSDVDTTSLSHTYTGLQDGSTYQLAVRAYDKLGNVSGWKFSSTYTVGDYTAPSQPYHLSITPSDWTNNTSPLLEWSNIYDNNLARAEYKIDYGEWISIPTKYGIDAGEYNLPCQDLPDGTHLVYVRGVDKVGHIGGYSYVSYYKDTQAPTATISIPNSKPIGGKITIHANIENESYLSEFDHWELKYGLGTDVAPADMITIAEGTNLVSNDILCSWNISGLEENQVYSLYLYVSDEVGNTSVSNSVTLLKAENSEEVAPQLVITDPKENEDLTDTQRFIYFNYLDADKKDDILSYGYLYANSSLVGIQHNNSKDAYLDLGLWDTAANDWKYPEGQYVFMYVMGEDENQTPVYSVPTYKTVNCCTNLSSIEELYNTQNIVSDGKKVSLINSGNAYAASGQLECASKKFAGNVVYVELVVDENKPKGTSIDYEVSSDGGNTWSWIAPVSTDGGANVTAHNRMYFSNKSLGNDLRIRATLNTNDPSVTPSLSYIGADVGYTVYSTAILVDNDFAKNARGFTSLENVVHDETNSRIILSEGSTEGSIRSTVRTTPSDVIEAVLNVDAVTPEGSYIDYFISTDGGATYEQITPGNPNVSADWKKLETEGKKVILKAQLHSDGTAVPELKNWRLSVKTLASGQPHMVKLVDDPTNLSALNGANYQTLLRWKGSATEGVTYNIYRSETPYFTPAPSNLIASGIEETSWSDYNLNYGKTFYYQVTAVKQMGGHDRESLPSNQAWATVVDENEVQKRLGLQDYWSYMGFKTGSGDGYINVSNGNVSYISTDMMVSDPFFAMVMRRTYNSMATTKTPLGYGWDFSFNTALLREYSSENIETGMILKDGDGSFHRFKKNSSGGYDSAKGTFMKLVYDETADEYTITRKDNIVYHFDAQSMKLKSFTNPNGNALTFEYDERGNLSAVENTVGERIEISYNVSGANPTDEDYLYVNEHVDMVDTVTWKEDARTKDSAEIVYHYVYGEDDKLDRAYMVIENNNEYGESFSYNDDGELFEITNPEGKKYILSYTNSKVTKIEDPIDTFNFNYNSDITKAIDQNGVTTIYYYDEEGRVTKKIDGLGHETNYKFNENFQVTEMNFFNTVNGNSQETKIIYSYEYDENGNLLSIIGPNGSQTLYEGYNEYNQPLSMKIKQNNATWLTTTYTYDNNGNLLTTTDPRGKVETRTYGIENGNFGYLTSVTNCYGFKTTYTYDNKGRLIKTEDFNKDGSKYRTVAEYTYDDFGRTSSITDPLGRITQYEYNKLGLLTKTIFADGSITQTEYSLLGNVNRVTDQELNVTDYIYDEKGRLIETIYPDNSKKSIEYNKWDSDGDGIIDSDKVIETDQDKRQTVKYYDKVGNIVKAHKQYIKDDGTIIAGTSSKYEYDLLGNLIKATDEAGRVTTAQYNVLGQKTKIISDPNGKNISFSYTYDLLDNLISKTDGNGNTTYYSYDNINRLKEVTQSDGNKSITTSYEYDIQDGDYIKNRLIDANGNITEYIFDISGRKVEDRAIGEVSSTTRYQYNKNNDISLLTRNDGSKEKYSYNELGKTKRIDYYTSNQDVSKPSNYYVTYEYNKNGNITQKSVTKNEDTEITSYSYNNMDQIIQMTQGLGSVGALSIDYSYDNSGNVESVSYPKEDNQSGIAAKGNGKQTIVYNYDGFNRISSIKLGTTKVRDYVYNSGGDLSYVKNYRNFNENGNAFIKIDYSYDTLGVPFKTTFTDFTSSEDYGVKREQFTIEYDLNGNLTSEKLYSNYEEEKTINKIYEYDNFNRLTKVINDGKETVYTYDNIGNRKTENVDGHTYTYTYNNLNQLLNKKEGSNIIASYEYDDLGNQTKEVLQYVKVTVGDNTKNYNQETIYSYDLRNLLTQTSVKTPVINEYTGEATYNTAETENDFDAEGNRICRVEDDKTTRYYYMGNALLYSTNEKNVLQTENILDLSGQVIASKRFKDPSQIEGNKYANKYYFYHYDIRGSVTNIIAPDGSLVKEYNYDEFGKTVTKGQEEFKNDITYASSISDKSSNLQYMGARFYQPSTGRFLSQDSYSGNPYDPWTQHLYVYCGNNPTSMIDPTGHYSQELIDDVLSGKYGMFGGISNLTTEQIVSNALYAYNKGYSKETPYYSVAAGTFTSEWGGSSSQHRAVQLKTAIKVGGFLEVKIQGGAASGRPDTYGRIDVATLVNPDNTVANGAQIYEIKPISQKMTGVGQRQLQRYIDAAKLQGIIITRGPDPHVGNVVMPDGTIIATEYDNGVIYYQRTKKKQEQEAPAVVPVPEKEEEREYNGGGVQIDWQRTGAVAVGVISVFVGLFMWIYDGGATFSRGLQALGF